MIRTLLATVLVALGVTGAASAVVKPDPLYWTPAKAAAQVLAHPQIPMSSDETRTVTSLRGCEGMVNAKFPLATYPMLSKKVNGQLAYRHFRCAINSTRTGDGRTSTLSMLLFIRVTQPSKFCWSAGIPGSGGAGYTWHC